MVLGQSLLHNPAPHLHIQHLSRTIAQTRNLTAKQQVFQTVNYS